LGCSMRLVLKLQEGREEGREERNRFTFSHHPHLFFQRIP
jgi:hypothetical protein